MFEKLKQYKDLRDKAKKLQNELAQETVQADVLGGKVNVVMDGNQKILALDINPELLNPEKKEELEKALIEVIDQAIKKIQRVMAQKIQGGGMNLPNLG